jgi:hypothetical protein
MVKCVVRIGGEVRNIQHFFTEETWIIDLESMIRLERLVVMHRRHQGPLKVLRRGISFNII